MAEYAVPSTHVGAHGHTLVANAVDIVTFADSALELEVVSDGAAELYFTVDGSTPSVGGTDCFYLPASASSRTIGKISARYEPSSPAVVKLISAGTPKYSVSRLVD